MWQEDEEEGVRSYWMILRTGEDTANWRRKLYIALCGGIILEEALDMSFDRLLMMMIMMFMFKLCRSQWPRGPRRGSAAARLPGLWVRTPPGAWKSVCCEFCVFSGRGLCDGLITRPGESYRLWCVWVWSWSLDNEEGLAHWGGCRAIKNQNLNDIAAL